jgi:hypothetical protein
VDRHDLQWTTYSNLQPVYVHGPDAQDHFRFGIARLVVAVHLAHARLLLV